MHTKSALIIPWYSAMLFVPSPMLSPRYIISLPLYVTLTPYAACPGLGSHAPSKNILYLSSLVLSCEGFKMDSSDCESDIAAAAADLDAALTSAKPTSVQRALRLKELRRSTKNEISTKKRKKREPRHENSFTRMLRKTYPHRIDGDTMKCICDCPLSMIGMSEVTVQNHLFTCGFMRSEERGNAASTLGGVKLKFLSSDSIPGCKVNGIDAIPSSNFLKF